VQDSWRQGQQRKTRLRNVLCTRTSWNLVGNLMEEQLETKCHLAQHGWSGCPMVPHKA
jgi:hypothetical protein